MMLVNKITIQRLTICKGWLFIRYKR